MKVFVLQKESSVYPFKVFYSYQMALKHLERMAEKWKRDRLTKVEFRQVNASISDEGALLLRCYVTPPRIQGGPDVMSWVILSYDIKEHPLIALAEMAK